MSDLFDTTKKIDGDFLKSTSIDGEILLVSVVKQLNELSAYYPDFVKWLSIKVIPGLYNGERKILLHQSNNKLAGIAIIKDTIFEKKLCCLRVLPEFQGTGIGLKLFERSFEELNTNKPLLSIAEEQKQTFRKLFEHYGFELAEIYEDYYRPKKKEFSFNGLITPHVENSKSGDSLSPPDEIYKK